MTPLNKRKKSLKTLCKYMIVLFFCVLTTLFISEAGLRAMNISYPVFHSFDYERGKVLKPGKKGWWTSEGNAYVEINQAGFRDIEHALKKPIGTYRIAALGDSYTEARHVAIQDTFPKKLERYLNACKQLNYDKVEVLNFGVSGYGTAEELLTLRNSVWGYEPDLVLTTFFAGNDVLDNYPPAKPHWDGIAHRPYFFFDKNELKLNDFIS